MRDVCRAAVAALLLVAAAPAAPAAAEGDPDMAAVAEAAQSLWEEAFATGDGARAAEMVFTENARLLPDGAPIVEGREAIAQFWQGYFDAGLTNLRLSLIEGELVGEDTFIETGTWTVTVPNADGTTMDVGGKALVIWKREADGVWRMDQDMWNMDTPPAPAAE